QPFPDRGRALVVRQGLRRPAELGRDRADAMVATAEPSSELPIVGIFADERLVPRGDLLPSRQRLLPRPLGLGQTRGAMGQCGHFMSDGGVVPKKQGRVLEERSGPAEQNIAPALRVLAIWRMLAQFDEGIAVFDESLQRPFDLLLPPPDLGEMSLGPAP